MRGEADRQRDGRDNVGGSPLLLPRSPPSLSPPPSLLSRAHLHGLDDIQVVGLNLGVLVGIEVLLGGENTVHEESLVDGLTLLLGDEHPFFFLRERKRMQRRGRRVREMVSAIHGRLRKEGGREERGGGERKGGNRDISVRHYQEKDPSTCVTAISLRRIAFNSHLRKIPRWEGECVPPSFTPTRGERDEDWSHRLVPDPLSCLVYFHGVKRDTTNPLSPTQLALAFLLETKHIRSIHSPLTRALLKAGPLLIDSGEREEGKGREGEGYIGNLRS